MKNPPNHLTKILWEYDIEELKKTSPIVLERVLTLWNNTDIDYVGLSKLRDYFIEKKPLLDPKSNNFWSLIFDTPSSQSPSSYDLINTPVFYRNFR